MSAYDVLPDEVRRVSLGNLGMWLRLNPLSEVVDGEFILPRGSWELADDVHTPFSKGSWNEDATERGWRLSRNVGKTLAFVASSCPIAGIFLHCRPKIALLERFEREGSLSRVISAYAFVDFAEDLSRLYALEASE